MVRELANSDLFQSVSEMREELDDHLNSINENTEEIETNFSYLLDINKRMKHLESKMDKILGFMAKIENFEDLKPKTKKLRVTKAEQDVFLLFYQSQQALSVDDIALRMVKSPSHIRSCINMMIEKGVPLTRNLAGRKTFYTLDPAFKELQAKNSVVAIERDLTLECFDQEIIQ